MNSQQNPPIVKLVPGLTVTKVVFEFYMALFHDTILYRLTVTKVVFELNFDIDSASAFRD